MEKVEQKRRTTFTKEQKREMAENTTEAAFAHTERERVAREEKSARLRALRLGAAVASAVGDRNA